MKTETPQKILLAILALTAIFFAYLNYSSDFNSQNDAATTTITAQVQQVLDGDTLRVRIPATTSTAATTTDVRLIGIDAPEINWEEKTDACFGFEAQAYLENQVADAVVVLRQDSRQAERDDYDRLLAYVYRDGVDINRELIKLGYARELTVANGYRKQPNYRAAEQMARSNERGLWSACVDE